MTTIRSLLVCFALATLGATGCDQDTRLAGSFSDASYEDRGYAIETATGLPVTLGLLHIIFADMAAESEDCIVRTRDGDIVTLTGVACDPGDDSTFEGSVTVYGWRDFEDDDDDDEFFIDFDGFTMRGDNGNVASVDGTVEVSQGGDGSGVTHADLVAQIGDNTLEFTATMVCDAAPAPCRYENASGSTSALGAFAVEGTFRDRTGTLEVVAYQRMVIDFDASSQGCAPVTIDGQSVDNHCFQSPETNEQ